jgi:hypothetical protein
MLGFPAPVNNAPGRRQARITILLLYDGSYAVYIDLLSRIYDTGTCIRI